MTDPFTPIHHDVLDALMKINLSPYETRILFAIWRKTYGFVDRATGKQKKSDWISLSQFSLMTGLDRRLVNRALQGLKKKSVISRDDKRTGFSKEFMKSLTSIKMTKKVTSVEMTKGDKMTSVEMSPPVKNDDKVTSILSPTIEKIETNTIERVSKDTTIALKKSNRDINQIIAHFKVTLKLPVIDGSVQENRRYAWLLLKKFKTTEQCIQLIQALEQHKFWSTKVTSMKSLYHNAVNIISSARDKRLEVTYL